MAKNKATNHYLFSHGNHFSLYRYLGAHKKINADGSVCTVFRVWAPNADSVFVIGDFNGWKETCEMKKQADGGIWQASAALDFSNEDKLRYKYLIFNKDKITVKADPFAFYGEASEDGASYLYELQETDNDGSVRLASRGKNKNVNSPMNIYELDPGTFYRNRDGSFMNYVSLAERIAPYARKMGFTHVRFPLFTRCAGREKITAGRFGADSRFGSPSDLRAFISALHRYSVGVILDIPLLEFEESESGLNDFDGGAVFERKEKEYGGGIRTFDTDKDEIVSFLISSVMFFVGEYGIDGVCLDFSSSLTEDDHRSKSAAALVKKLNRILSDKYPDVLLICEPGVRRSALTKPLFSGGTGFDYASDEAAACDITALAESGEVPDSVLNGRFAENYIIPVRPAELLPKDRFASRDDKAAFYRAYLLFTACLPGKNMICSGCEYADFDGRKRSDLMNWYNASSELNSKVLLFTSDLNYFYLNSPELWKLDSDWSGYKLIRNEKGLTAFVRYAPSGFVICVFNFTDKPVKNKTIGVPNPGFYSEVFTSRSKLYGGTGELSLPIRAKNVPCDGCGCSLTVDVMPYSGSVYKSESMINKH